MLWDETQASWATFGITGQPAVVIVGTDGEITDGWLGVFDAERALTAIEG